MKLCRCMYLYVLIGLMLFGTVIPVGSDDCFCHEDSDFTDVPVGQIFMWYQDPSLLPWGWYVCNGTDVDMGHGLSYVTPDMQSMFLVGWNSSDADYDAIGEKGGLKSVTLSVDNLPVHTHSAPTTILTDLRGTPGSYGNAAGLITVRRTLSVKKDIQLSRNVGVNGGSHENRPLYRTVFYVMYLGV